MTPSQKLLWILLIQIWDTVNASSSQVAEFEKNHFQEQLKLFKNFGEAFVSAWPLKPRSHYLHIVTCHTVFLWKRLKTSLNRYANQGTEATNFHHAIIGSRLARPCHKAHDVMVDRFLDLIFRVPEHRAKLSTQIATTYKAWLIKTHAGPSSASSESASQPTGSGLQPPVPTSRVQQTPPQVPEERQPPPTSEPPRSREKPPRPPDRAPTGEPPPEGRGRGRGRGRTVTRSTTPSPFLRPVAGSLQSSRSLNSFSSLNMLHPNPQFQPLSRFPPMVLPPQARNPQILSLSHQPEPSLSQGQPFPSYGLPLSYQPQPSLNQSQSSVGLPSPQQTPPPPVVLATNPPVELPSAPGVSSQQPLSLPEPTEPSEPRPEPHLTIQAPLLPKDIPLVRNAPKLENLKNTCWFNAAIQFLRASLRWIPTLDFSTFPDSDMATALVQIFDSEGLVIPNTLVGPSGLMWNILKPSMEPCFIRGKQSDAHECITQIFNRLSIWDARQEFVHLHTGCWKASRSCFHQHPDGAAVTYEVFQDLELPIPQQKPVSPKQVSQKQLEPLTLMSLIQKFGSQETVDIKCPSCQGYPLEKIPKKEFVRGYRSLTITQWPPTLIIQLKRFYNRGKSLYKNNTQVECPEDIELGEYTYQLISVVLHSGSLAGGHYTALIKTNESWLLCNDNHVSPTTYDPGNYRSSAYLLCYQRS